MSTQLVQLKKWFSDRGLKSLDYQEDIILKKLNTVFTKKEPTVLAAAPSAGKTIMSICFAAERYLKKYPHARVLVLAHGHSILKRQYFDVVEYLNKKLNFSFEFKLINFPIEILQSDAQFVVSLPQTLVNLKKLPHFDLVIYDEGHQYYSEPMVQEILKKVKPKHQLILTGSPSKFIGNKKYHIHPIAVNQLYEHGMIEDITVEISRSAYNFGYKQYNGSEIKNNIKFKKQETGKTLKKLLAQIIKRLVFIHRNNQTKYIPHKKDKWKQALTMMGKTLFACRNQEQAKQTYTYLRLQGVNAVMSTVDTDKHSKEIYEKFIVDKDVLVLIVVYRGTLGFNYPELETIVDMTGSQNIDRIFQLMCRILRPHPNKHKKTFFKLAPTGLELHFSAIMQGVVSLTDENFYTKFNGKNFIDEEIIIDENQLKNKRKIRKKQSGYHHISRLNLKSTDAINIPSIIKFNKIKNDTKNNINEFSGYSRITFREIREVFYLRKKWTDDRILNDAQKYKHKSEWKKKSTNAYQAGRGRGKLFFDKCCEHMKPLRVTKYLIKDIIADAKKHTTLKAWRKGSPNLYSAAVERHMVGECCQHMRGLQGYDKKLKDIEIKNSARKYNSRGEWMKKSPTTYYRARYKGNKFYDECCKHMSPKQRTKKYSNNELKEIAKKYTTPYSWAKDSMSTYNIALKRGKKFHKECCQHMTVQKRTKYTKNSLIREAKKHTSSGEWKKNASASYLAASRRKILKECRKHYKKS